jgi:N-acetylglucosamine-6-phosphate deacetylase
VTSPRETVEAARAALLAGPPAGYVGAVPLGLHVEDPFLSPERAGARSALIRDPDPAFVAGWTPDGGVRIVTWRRASGALALIGGSLGAGSSVAIRHTARPRQARAAFDAGAGRTLLQRDAGARSS